MIKLEKNIIRCITFFYILLEHPSTKTFRKFYTAIDYDTTDYGYCCQINPYLNFLNPKTVLLDGNDFTSEDYLSVPKGSTNGIQGGLKFILDAETFNYAYLARGESGFRLSLTDPRDKPIINQNSFYISTGDKLMVAFEYEYF